MALPSSITHGQKENGRLAFYQRRRKVKKKERKELKRIE